MNLFVLEMKEEEEEVRAKSRIYSSEYPREIREEEDHRWERHRKRNPADALHVIKQAKRAYKTRQDRIQWTLVKLNWNSVRER